MDNQKGMEEGLSLWGRVCSRKNACANCMVGKIRGTGITCQEFAKQFPRKMLSILKEMDEGQISYYEEYVMRFPDCNLDVETLSKCVCRKAVFEGDLSCNDEFVDCVACWEQKYVGDIQSNA